MMNSSLRKSSIVVPPGHVLVNKRWQGSPLGSALSKGNFIFSDEMGFVDFFPSETCPVIYITEADAILDSVYSRKINQLSQNYETKGVVVTHRTNSFKEVQDLATIQLHLTTIPIANQMELPRLLPQMAYAESRPGHLFRFATEELLEKPLAAMQISLLNAIPGLGDTGAKRLLSIYGNIQGVANAPRDRIAAILGPAAAKEISHFFESPSTSIGPPKNAL